MMSVFLVLVDILDILTIREHITFIQSSSALSLRLLYSVFIWK